ncbi:MAG: acetoacetyl-CoA synthetase [Candidatus Marinamargulisbacteria bacterium]|jgi:acetoacetyl-CoA synthetase
MTHFLNQANQECKLSMTTYPELYAWSISHAPLFWELVSRFTGLKFQHEASEIFEEGPTMIESKWFSGATLNYAENCLKFRDDRPALIVKNETKPDEVISYSHLYDRVSQVAFSFREMGLKKGDRIAGVTVNNAETIVAFLAAASIGAIWSSCSPDFGVNGILDRFKQIEPRLLIAVNGYTYNGKIFSCQEKLEKITQQLSSVESLIIINQIDLDISLSGGPSVRKFEALLDRSPDTITFDSLPFDHPLYILYSSGTTGLPKSIIHGAGGTLIQHLKEHQLHCDLSRESVLFFYTTCGWMMWNWLVSALSTGCTLVLFDGSPFFPGDYACWKFIEENKITHFGTSARFISASMHKNLSPKKNIDMNSLRCVLSTGSPLLEEHFDYVYSDVKSDVQLSSISGGTDIVSCFVLGNPILPVYRNRIQCRGLGMAVQSYNDAGAPVINQTGELVCTQSFPNMPIGFWNDPNHEKYRKAYFNKFDGVWSHGDFLIIDDLGGVQILGRSDATLNPGGVRIGTAEIYRVVESIPGINDSLVIGRKKDDDEEIVLFIKLDEPVDDISSVAAMVRAQIKKECSPRHVPKHIFSAPDIPYTLNGKKVEIAIKKIFSGHPVVANQSVLGNPECLDYYRSINDALRSPTGK